MAVSRCPHCQAPMPESDDAGAFCTTCGRRVAGWGKAPRAPKQKGAAPLVDGNAVTRRADSSDIEAALAAAAAAKSSPRLAPDDVPADPDDPNATVKLEPPSSTAVTEQRMPVGPSESSELDAVPAASPTPRLLRVIGLALAAGSLAAGGAFFLYRQLNPPPPPRPPVTVNLDAPPAPLPVDPADPNASKTRRRGKRATTTTPATVTTAAATKSGTSPTTATPTTTAPTTATPPTTTTAAGTATTASATTPPATPPPETATTTKPAETVKKPEVNTAYIPTDTDETVPPTEEELAEEAKAAQFAEGIRFVARRYRTQIEACYERAFKLEASSPGGRVDIAFTVNKDGRAKKISTITNTTGNPNVARCIEQLIDDWQFPRPPSGEFNTSYPFVFSGS